MLDFQTMAKAMITIGITKASVDENELAKAIEKLYTSFDDLKPEETATTQQDNQINQLMLQLVSVGKEQGIHFPREFALLLKQILYFDRYLQLLAPDMDILSQADLEMFNHINLNLQH